MLMRSHYFFVKWICHNNYKLTIINTREEKEMNFLFLEIEMSNKSERENDSLFSPPLFRPWVRSWSMYKLGLMDESYRWYGYWLISKRHG